MISFDQVSANVARVSFETDKERKALDRLLERKIRDKDSGLMVPITVAFADDRGAGFIPAGLVPWMVEVLDRKFRVTDNTMLGDDTYVPVGDTNFVGREPRSYQIDAARRLLAHPRGILQAITGAGKTSVMGAMIRAILEAQPDWRILVIGFTVDHWNQVRAALAEMQIKSQQVGRGQPKAQVAIGRFDAFLRNITNQDDAWNRYIRTAEVILYDEVRHLGTASTYIQFARQVNPLRSYGFDATPLKNYEQDGDPHKFYEDMQTVGYCGPIRQKIGYRELQRQGYLPLTYVHFVPMPRPPRQLMSSMPRNIHVTSDYTSIYKHWIVENDYRTSRFSRLITNLAGGGKVIALIKQHEHARRLMRMLLENDIESLAWFGAKKALATSPARGVIDAPFSTDEVKRRFLETDLRVVVGSVVLSEAISLDAATDIVNLAAGNTFSLSAQRGGRIMRRDKGRTPVCHYWDSEDQGNRVMEIQSRKRREHCIAVGLDVIESPAVEVLGNLHDIGLTTVKVAW